MNSGKKVKAIDFLKHLPLFDDLTEEGLQQLEALVQEKKFRKGTYIYRTGELSDTVFFLVKGTVKVGTNSDEGREVIKHILHPMAMFGELCLVGESHRSDFGIAIHSDVQLYLLKAGPFKRLMHNNHKLSMKLLQLIGGKLIEAENRLESLIFKDARERIVDFLKDSASSRGKQIGYEMLIKHHLTQQDIANITGTSRQTVTSVLNDLKKSNLIYFNRRSILIRDVTKLA